MRLTVWFLLILLGLQIPSAGRADEEADARWPRFSFSGEPWDGLREKEDIATALRILTKNPLDVAYFSSHAARYAALRTLKEGQLLDSLRRDLEALRAAAPDSIPAAFLLSELDEFERPKEAAASLGNLAKLLPDDIAVAIRWSRALFRANELAAAESQILPVVLKYPDQAFTLDPRFPVDLFAQSKHVELLGETLLKWKQDPSAQITDSAAWPFFSVAQQLRAEGKYILALQLLEHAMDQLDSDRVAYLLPSYLQYLSEKGMQASNRAKGVEPALRKLFTGTSRSGADVLAADITHPVTRESLPRLHIILEYLTKLDVRDVLLKMKPETSADTLIYLTAAAFARDQREVKRLQEYTESIEQGEVTDENELLLASYLGQLAFHNWPDNHEAAIALMSAAAAQMSWEQSGAKVEAWNRVADARIAEGDADGIRAAAENGAKARLEAFRSNGQLWVSIEGPPPEFKTAQLLAISGSKMDPQHLISPYAVLNSVPEPLQILTESRFGQVQAKLTGELRNPEVIAFTFAGPAGARLAVQIAPGPLRGAHTEKVFAGQPVNIHEIDGKLDLQIWYGKSPEKLEMIRQMDSAPSFSELDFAEYPGLGYVRVDTRTHGNSEDAFNPGTRIYPVFGGVNLAPDPKLSDIQPGNLLEKPSVVPNWSSVPVGSFSAGDKGPLPDTPALRFLPRDTASTPLQMNRIPLKQGKKYFQSAWIRSPPRPGTITAAVRFLDKDGKQIGESTCPEDFDDPRWLFTSQVLTSREPENDREVRIPEGTVYLLPVLNVWNEADWCGHFFGESE